MLIKKTDLIFQNTPTPIQQLHQGLPFLHQFVDLLHHLMLQKIVYSVHPMHHIQLNFQPIELKCLLLTYTPVTLKSLIIIKLLKEKYLGAGFARIAVKLAR